MVEQDGGRAESMAALGMTCEDGPGVVGFGTFTMHLTYGDFDDGVALEFRARTRDYKPTLSVLAFGHPVPEHVALVTFDVDVPLAVVREVITFARKELVEEIRRAGVEPGAVDTTALDPGPPGTVADVSPVVDAERRPGVEFTDPGSGRSVATVWRTVVEDEPTLVVRLPDDVEVRTFEALAEEAERRLLGGQGPESASVLPS